MINNEELIKKYYERISEQVDYKDFISKVENKKNLLGDLCDEEMCIQLVLNDLNMLNEYESKPTMNISNSNENIDNINKLTIKEIKTMNENKFVSLTCKIINEYNLKEFIKKDNTKGYLLSFIVSDNTGKIKLNIWNEKIKIINNENIGIGSTINVSGFLNNNNNNNIDINVYDIQLSTENIEIKNKDIKIKDINNIDENVIIKGKILFIKETKSFFRKNNTKGKLKQIVIGDDTGIVTINLWDDQIDKYSNLNIGDSIEINDLNIKKNNYTNTFEISIPKSSSGIKKLEYDITYNIIFTKIGYIENLKNNLNVIGKIINISDINTFIKKDGSEGTIGYITIGDDTGKMNLKLWDNNTVYLDDFNYEDVISIQNCFSKINSYTKKIELNINKNSIIQKENKKIEYIENNSQIKDIIPGHIYKINGEIINKENDENIQDDRYNNKITIKDNNSDIIDIFYSDYQKNIFDQLDIGDNIMVTNSLSCYDNINKKTYLIINNESKIN